MTPPTQTPLRNPKRVEWMGFYIGQMKYGERFLKYPRHYQEHHYGVEMMEDFIAEIERLAHEATAEL